METPQAVNLFWQIMFGEDYVSSVDVNKPENQLYAKHVVEQKTKGIKTWLSQGGEYLMQDMMKKVKSRMCEFAGIPLDTIEQRNEAIGKLKQYQMEIDFLVVLLSAIQEKEK